MKDALVFIGRFQPFHNGHKAVIDEALKQAKQVVVVVGSSFAARNIRNPFTVIERKAMIEAVYGNETIEVEGKTQLRVKVVGISDYPYDDTKWVAAVMRAVGGAVPHAKDIGLIGHSKDHTSYYLNIFPEWKGHVEVPNVDNINATDIRTDLFAVGGLFMSADLMPIEALNSMKWSLEQGVWWPHLRTEYEMIHNYKKVWAAAPYPPTFVTVDAVVIQSGHVLLVERSGMPGKGLHALPGGFLDQKETMENGMIRELREETRLKVPSDVLRGSIKGRRVFDAPNRSTRGRTITQAFHIELKSGPLPKVRGGDDAYRAFWHPLSDLKQECMFEDHFHIIDSFIPVFQRGYHEST
jgi:bifunctional NMN adenylyltransferase/nudix hydrolase